MSVVSIPTKHRHVKQRRKFDRFANPPVEQIPNLWAELSAAASLAPGGQSIGAHLLRSRLLDAVPSWKLPEILDSLATEGVSA